MIKYSILVIKSYILRGRLFFNRIDRILDGFNKHIPRLLRITKTGLITTLVAFTLSVSVVTAQTNDPVSDPSNSNLGDFGTSWNIVFFRKIGCFLQGCSGVDETANASDGVLDGLNNVVSMTYEQSNVISGSDYVASVLEDASFMQPAHAQTPGYVMLNPAQKLWGVMRTIALTFLIVMSIVLAFMILLRVREGQGFVTIANAYPKIVVAMILIPLSFGISGLLMDLVNISSNVVLYTMVNSSTGLFESPNPAKFPYSVTVKDSGGIGSCDATKCPDYNVFRLMSRMVSFKYWGERECTTEDKPEDRFLNETGQEKCILRIQDIINTPTEIPLVDGAVNVLDQYSLGAKYLLDLIILIMMIMIVFKVFIALLMAFLQILLRTIFAPVQFLLIPLRGYGVVTDWAKGMLANVLVFPATLLLILVSAVFSNINQSPFFVSGEALGEFKTAPLMLLHSVGQPEGSTGSTNLSFLGKALGVAVLTIIPQVPNLLKELFQQRTPAALQAAGATFKSAASKIPVVGNAIGNLAG